MKTTGLTGNLLNMYAALALGGKEDVDLRIAFDEGASVIYKGNNFEPDNCLWHGWDSIWPAVLRLKIGSVPDHGELWRVTMPTTAGSHTEPFPPLYCLTPIDGYRIAIVWSVYGAEVPDTFNSSVFGTVDLTQFNG